MTHFTLVIIIRLFTLSKFVYKFSDMCLHKLYMVNTGTMNSSVSFLAVGDFRYSQTEHIFIVYVLSVGRSSREYLSNGLRQDLPLIE